MPQRYYQRRIFDNSLTAGSYQPSCGAAVAPSELALVRGKLQRRGEYVASGAGRGSTSHLRSLSSLVVGCGRVRHLAPALASRSYCP